MYITEITDGYDRQVFLMVPSKEILAMIFLGGAGLAVEAALPPSINRRGVARGQCSRG